MHQIKCGIDIFKTHGMGDKRCQLDITVHGFRSSFRDWAAEQTNYPREVAEAALAHAIQSRVEAAYRRSDLFDKRRNLMADWARFIETPPRGNDNVLSLRGTA